MILPCPLLINKAGCAVADLTALQAMHRELGPGESRKGFCGKARKGVAKRKRHNLSVPIQARLVKVIDG